MVICDVGYAFTSVSPNAGVALIRKEYLFISESNKRAAYLGAVVVWDPMLIRGNTVAALGY